VPVREIVKLNIFHKRDSLLSVPIMHLILLPKNLQPFIVLNCTFKVPSFIFGKFMFTVILFRLKVYFDFLLLFFLSLTCFRVFGRNERVNQQTPPRLPSEVF